MTASTEKHVSTSAHPRGGVHWTFYVGVLALLGLGWLAAEWLLFSNPPIGDEEVQRAEERRAFLAEVRKDAEQKLTTYGWMDQAKGVVHIPIDRAMAMEVEALRESKPRSAYPIVDPAAAAAPMASPGAAAGPASGAPQQAASPAASPLEGTPAVGAAPAASPAPPVNPEPSPGGGPAN